jgi:hypothetical protein
MSCNIWAHVAMLRLDVTSLTMAMTTTQCRDLFLVSSINCNNTLVVVDGFLYNYVKLYVL